MSALAQPRTLRWIGVFCLLAACDGATVEDGGPREDGGPQADGGVDSGTDGGPAPDREAPRVTSTRPASGAELVARASSLEVRFSEPVVAASGTLSATSGGAPLALGAASWEAEGDVLRVAAVDGWPGGARVEVRITAFADAAGNVQDGAHELFFFTSDEGAPSVRETSPVEGASDVDPALEVLVVRFDEPMSPVLGELTLEGGPGRLGARAWSSSSELRVAVEGLRPGTTYRVALDGFEDTSGNALDPAPVLGDGALDFTTAPDVTPPRVVDSSPTHDQLDVDVGTLRSIEVTFSEPMDTSVRTATLTADGSSTTLTGNWSVDQHVITFAVVGRVAVDAENRLDLSAMRDRAGNAVDGEVGLSDGELVFTTSSADEALPFVVFTTPVEGATDVSPRLTTLTVLFSEAMDTTRTTLELVSPAGARVLEGTWNTAGTRLSAPTGGLAPRTSHTVDLRAFRDASGNALDATHPYLGDGVLDLTTGAATGESCVDALSALDAAVDGAALVWELEPGQFVSDDGAPSCSFYTDILDGVIAYEKTSGDVASGGRALRITATSPDAFNGVQLEVFRDVCEPAGVGGGDAAREVCLTSRRQWVQYLDVPAGTYYVWVGGERGRVCSSSPPFTCSSYAFPGATVRIEEIDAVPEGESCSAPFDASSSIHSSPAADEHVWVVPHGAGTSADYGTSTYGAGSVRCFTRQGPDAVIRLDKARATSLLDVTIDPLPADSFSATDPGGWSLDRAGVIADVVDRCDALGPDTTSLACPGRINRERTFQVTGDAGDYYLWLTATNSEVDLLRTTVRVREVDPAPGESCQSAIGITPGTSNAVSPSSTAAYFPPSCVPAAGGITWYRFTTTREVSVVSVEGTGALALIDAASGSELGCLSDASSLGVPRRATPGQDVCVAVPSDSGITGIAVRELDWRGVRGEPTDLNIGRPLTDTGAELSITGESFLVVTPTQLYMGINPGSASTTTTAPALVTAPRAGGVIADRILVDRFSIGSSAVTTGEALFSVEETARPSRLFRLIDGTGSASTTPWDTGSAYESPVIHAMGPVVGTSTLLLANRGTTTVPTTFYSASTAAPAAVARLGQNAALRDVTAIASDGTWIYLIGATGAGTTVRTLYRLPLADVTTAPEPLAPAALLGFSATQGSMALDADRDVLYFRSTSVPRGVHAVFDASTATPTYVGPVFERGGSADHGLALDPAVPSLFLFETETQSTGSFVELR